MAEPFYAEGLRFSCTRCAFCCRGDPGYVFLSKRDIMALLTRLDLDFRRFYQEYCTLVDTGSGMVLSLRERRRLVAGGAISNDCVFWAEEGCSVYQDRPIQCSSYPFWSSILDTKAAWRAESRSCPGIGCGELRSRPYIEERLLARRRAGPLVLGYDVDPECADEDTILGSSGLGADSVDAVEG